MRRAQTVIVSVCLVFTSFFPSCKKDQGAGASLSPAPSVEPLILRCPPGEDKIAFYSSLFLYNAAFEKVVEHFGNGAFSMVLRVHRSGGLSLVQRFGSLVNSYSAYSEVERFYLQHRIDAWAMLEYHAGILASLLNLYKSHPDFYNLPLQDQCTVIRNVFGILGDAVFRSDNPKSPVVARYDQLLVDLGAMDDVAARISMADVQDCLQEAVLGAVMNSFQTIRQLWQVINGYNLGWDGILHVARSALKTIVGSSVGGALVGFGLCIAWEYFW